MHHWEVPANGSPGMRLPGLQKVGTDGTGGTGKQWIPRGRSAKRAKKNGVFYEMGMEELPHAPKGKSGRTHV